MSPLLINDCILFVVCARAISMPFVQITLTTVIHNSSVTCICMYNIVGAVSYSSTFQSQKQQFIIMVYYANQPRFELIITLYSLHDHD